MARVENTYHLGKKPKKRVQHISGSFFFLLVFIGLFAHLTNPFTRTSVIRNPFKISVRNNSITYTKRAELFAFQFPILRGLGNMKDAWHIFANKFSPPAKGKRDRSLDDIIDEIHWRRFDPSKPYLISGDHFSVLYPRSLGIFYNSMLDPRTARSSDDWLRRQILYLKTTLYALDAYKKTKNLSTTIVPIAPLSVVTVNHFNPPSDTLYSLLYAIDTLLSSESIQNIFPYQRTDSRTYTLATTDAGIQILKDYKDTLIRHLKTYLDLVVDPETGLIKRNIELSGEKDSVIRESAFYDNVILWKTLALSQKLGLIPEDQEALAHLKSKIISTFWDAQEGIFLDDLSAEAEQNHWYSSDWLIAVSSGFLNPEDKTDRSYLEQSVQYIDSKNLNRPFALKFQPESQPSHLVWILKIAASDYGTHAIWSNLGMEYTKLLLRLYQTTCNDKYLKEAEYQLDKYTDNIMRYQGFPELYDKTGAMYAVRTYVSVHQTGWIVGFEQAKAMYDSININTGQLCSSLHPR